jgi:hypothetical protein
MITQLTKEYFEMKFQSDLSFPKASVLYVLPSIPIIHKNNIRRVFDFRELCLSIHKHL